MHDHRLTRGIAGLACAIAVSIGLVERANADVQLFYLPDEWDAWVDLLGSRNLQVEATYDFDDFDDFGHTPFDGPLTEVGNDLIPSGYIAWENVIDSNRDPHGGDGFNGRGAGGRGLLALGPSAGFGNPTNAILANNAEDSFDFAITTDRFPALELSLTSIDGSGFVDLSIESFDYRKRTFSYRIERVPALAAGQWVGIAVGGNRTEWISRVNIYDPLGGTEGIQGHNVLYYAMPAPGTLAVLAMVPLAARRGRRLTEVLQ